MIQTPVTRGFYTRNGLFSPEGCLYLGIGTITEVKL